MNRKRTSAYLLSALRFVPAQTSKGVYQNPLRVLSDEGSGVGGRFVRRSKTKIEIQNVRKGFPGDDGRLDVIDDLSFNVGDGEFVAIVGPSGCGKTTLMNIIAGFLAPDSGAVLVDGRARSKPNANGILITQAGSVFPWLTVRENLLFGLDDSRPDREALAQEYAELVGLNGFENHYPHELSGGMLKRAEMARALVVKPEILFMDEPFSALDALRSLRMQKELLRILARERHTVLLITHDVEEAIHLADRILVLSPRPARIQATFDVPFAHPRRVSSPEAQALRVAVLKELGVEYTV
ncbi:MAG TPA: ABC transporter ATP-binding protein [Thermoanaerobaculia bacterium]|jgi:ABC-type nitrate/sulfonate/bicarbonate transport system ATPase subunit